MEICALFFAFFFKGKWGKYEKIRYKLVALPCQKSEKMKKKAEKLVVFPCELAFQKSGLTSGARTTPPPQQQRGGRGRKGAGAFAKVFLLLKIWSS